MTLKDFTLTRSIQPYAGLAIILGFVSILVIVTSAGSHDWSGSYALLAAWVFLYGPIVFIGTRYRVSWRDETIVQKAAGMADVSIKPAEITRVALETSDLQTLAAMRRPFRRITVYAEGDKATKFIDVSLKHFVADDIRRLMRAIHEKCPDVQLPKQWI